MARYAFRCGLCGYHEANLPMGQAPDLAMHAIGFESGEPPWEICTERAHRVLDVPYYTEDRRRLRQGISPVTRLPYAQSRREERQIEERMGIEFVTRETRPQEWKEAESYSNHLRTGGDAVTLKSEPAKRNQPGWLLKSVEERARR